MKGGAFSFSRTSDPLSTVDISLREDAAFLDLRLAAHILHKCILHSGGMTKA